MAIKIADEYTNAEPTSADYPGGSFKNRTTPSAEDGTPLEKAWANDMWGFGEALLAAGGVVHSGAPDTALASDRLTALRKLIANLTWPVGSVYYSNISTNPGITFGVGTWVAIATGRVIIGVDVATDKPAGSMGGTATHTLSTAEMPAHTHTLGHSTTAQWGTDNGGASTTDAGEARIPTLSVGTAGSGAPHNNMQPWLAKYIWERVA